MDVTTKARSWLAGLPLLEPLSKATETTLKPIYLYPEEFIEIKLDEDGRNFILRPIVGTLKRRCNCFIEHVQTGAEINCDCLHRIGYDYENFEERLSRGFIEMMKKIPECKEDRHHPGRWLAATTDFTALVIMHNTPDKKLIFKDKNAETIYKYMIIRFLAQTKNSLIGADFKINGKVPAMPAYYTEHPELPLADYQKVPVAMSVGAEHFGLFMQQGTGKTATTVARICAEARMHRLGKLGNRPRMMLVLVICPQGLRKNWENEIGRFATVPGKTVIMRGGKFKRIKAVSDAIRSEEDCEFGCLITSFEKVQTTWEAIELIPWDLIVMDESHYAKTPNTQRSRNTRELREKSSRRMILTGTPITNSVMDLWSQFEFLGEGMSGFHGYKEFKGFYGKFDKVGGDKSGIEKLVALKNLPLIQERLARITFSITKKEAGLNLPEKTYDLYEVNMLPKQREFYTQLCRQLAIEIEDAKKKAESTGKRMSADHVLTRLLRLAQITSGYVSWDPEYDADGNEISEGKVEQINPGKNPKIAAVLDMLESSNLNDPNEKTIVWFCFREDIQECSRALTKAGIKHVSIYGGVKELDREEAVRAFNEDPDCKVFLGTPQSCREGHNLVGYDYWNAVPKSTTYTSHEIWYSQNWSPVNRSQGEDRAHRRGTRSTVRITDLVVPGTVDQEIREVVQLKINNANAVQDIKELLGRILNVSLEDDDEE